jgi:hypothetical protein
MYCKCVNLVDDFHYKFGSTREIHSRRRLYHNFLGQNLFCAQKISWTFSNTSYHYCLCCCTYVRKRCENVSNNISVFVMAVLKFGKVAAFVRIILFRIVGRYFGVMIIDESI